MGRRGKPLDNELGDWGRDYWSMFSCAAVVGCAQSVCFSSHTADDPRER